MIFRTNCHFRDKITLAAAVLAAAATTGYSQDSVEDRLSPGNSFDFVDKERMNDPGDPDKIIQPGPDQVWYRANDGRFYFRDEAGVDVYEEDVYPNTRRRINNQLRPMLGVALNPTKRGLRVERVAEGSPAAEVGIRRGDIIRNYNQKAVTDANAFVNDIGRRDEGEQVQIGIDRDGEELEFEPTLRAAKTGPKTYRAAKPAIDGYPVTDRYNANEDWRRSYESLRREVEALRRDFDSIGTGVPTDGAVHTPELTGKAAVDGDLD